MREKREKKMQSRWIDINEYSRLMSVSISTIRRKIKKKELLYQMSEGKYLISVSEDQLVEKGLKNSLSETEELKAEITRLRNECDELRMLVNLYESSQKTLSSEPHGPPPLP